MKWLLTIIFDFNSIERRSSRERESENREWRGRENMFSIIKRHFHSSYGLRGKRKNVLHSDRVSPRFSPLFVLSLFSFFLLRGKKVTIRFRWPMDSTMLKRKRKNNWNRHGSLIFVDVDWPMLEFSGKHRNIDLRSKIK